MVSCFHILPTFSDLTQKQHFLLLFFVDLYCVSEDVTGKLTCINKTSSSFCSACLTLPGFLIPFFQPLINSGQSNFVFFHRNFRRRSKGSERGNESKLGLSASPKGTPTQQSTTELFSPSSRYIFPYRLSHPKNTDLGLGQRNIQNYTELN